MSEGGTSIPARDEFFEKAWDEWRASRIARQGVAPLTLYHYTTAEGGRAILSSSTLRASHVSFLNDSSETKYAEKVVRDSIESLAVEFQGDPVGTAVLKGLESRLEYWMGTTEPYVACFCEEGDLLSQWRGYGERSGGYALGLDTNVIIEVGLATGGIVKLRRLIYDPAEQYGWTQEFLRWLIAAGTRCGKSIEEVRRQAELTFTPIIEFLACFKHPAFQEEKEWRMLVTMPITRPPGIQFAEPAMGFRTAGGLIVPYLQMDWRTWRPDRQPIPVRDIVIGPTTRGETAMKGLQMLLPHAGIERNGVTIRFSRAPLQD